MKDRRQEMRKEEKEEDKRDRSADEAKSDVKQGGNGRQNKVGIKMLLKWNERMKRMNFIKSTYIIHYKIIQGTIVTMTSS